MQRLLPKRPQALGLGLATNSVLKGVTNLTIQATAVDSQHPVQQVDLFLDGYLVRTVTNIPPTQNNVVPSRLRNARFIHRPCGRYHQVGCIKPHRLKLMLRDFQCD